MSRDIGLGDVIRTWHALGRSESPEPALLRVLGLELELIPAAQPSAGLDRDVHREGPERELAETSSRSIAEPAPRPRGQSGVPLPGPLQAASLRSLPSRSPTVPSWANAGHLPDPTPLAPPVPPAPLFEPRRERALVAAAARTLRPEGAIDVPALVAAMAAGRPISALPRRSVRSLRGGLQLIVDRTPWMTPFSADVDALRRRIAGVAGPALQVITVRNDRREVAALPGSWSPRAGVPIVAITDLGRAAHRAGRGAAAALWAEAAQRARAAGAPLTVIVPGSRAAHESVTPPGIVVVPWDRATRVGRIARDARSARR